MLYSPPEFNGSDLHGDELYGGSSPTYACEIDRIYKDFNKMDKGEMYTELEKEYAKLEGEPREKNQIKKLRLIELYNSVDDFKDLKGLKKHEIKLSNIPSNLNGTDWGNNKEYYETLLWI